MTESPFTEIEREWGNSFLPDIVSGVSDDVVSECSNQQAHKLLSKVCTILSCPALASKQVQHGDISSPQTLDDPDL
ncbi:hypothetical protein CDAR_564881 [Caerostris darwini]|uniref:Uncharacterized protein n=1 Tax=Caerostris darwini TaxID=1538125 RepID=A0AAV4Q8D1_9ARAC|nr:hypothetical protein CDAR_564881 [Caerostris darwini]